MAKLVRTLAGYAGCSADTIASGSKAQVMYFIDDAKADIAALAAENERLREAHARIEAEHGATVPGDGYDYHSGHEYGLRRALMILDDAFATLKEG